MSDPVLKTNVSSEYLNLVEKVAALVHKISGNKLGEKQYFMIETRLRKRMLELGMKSPTDYAFYIEKNLQKESGILVGLITTHHTFFFREFAHFEYLKKVLPELCYRAKTRGDKTIKIWSAACSRGQESYSLAMFFEHYLPSVDQTVSYQILGSDIDDDSVRIAANGVYHQNEIKEVPMNFLGNHWAKGTGDIAMYAKVKDSLRKKCQFKVGNLLHPAEIVGSQKFDVIFCRNVFIYFEQHQIEKICGDLLKLMQPEGIFFSGISESLTGLKIDFSSVGPSIYTIKSRQEKTSITQISVTSSSIQRVPPALSLATSISEMPEVIKVMCVDDSPSIITLLKKILGGDTGFEVIATAVNGKDAIEKLKTVKVDIMTLDIHMPEMDGVTYLSKNFSSSHPPVVMISSASREDSDVAMRALKNGASDYVEKPSLQNLEERGEEIRSKLRTVVGDRLMGARPQISSLDLETSHKIALEDPKNKICILTASISDMKKLKKYFYDSEGKRPPTIIFFEGQAEILEALVRDFGKDFKYKVKFYDGISELHVEEIYFADMKKYFRPIQSKYEKYKTSIMCFGHVSKYCSETVINWKNAQLLLEDLGQKNNKKSHLFEVATDVVPATSFPYMSNVFFTKK